MSTPLQQSADGCKQTLMDAHGRPQPPTAPIRASDET